MIKKVERFMEQWHMVPENKKILVGFSGGADSLCLMEILRELIPLYGLSLYAVHVHHGLRGENADRDAAFVEAYCQSYGIPCRIFRVSAAKEAREKKISVEEAGRNLRYRIFAEMKEEWGAGAIAVAHHQNDQAETVLFQMARGSGLTGAGGIRPMNDGIIRPLLCVSKKEILSYLEQKKMTWQEDESNADTTYTRNCIRHEILPLLEEKINSGAVDHIAELALLLQQTEEYLRTVEDTVWNKIVQKRRDGIFLSETLLEEPELFHQRLILRAVEEQIGGRKDVTGEHIRSVKGLFFASCGKQICLPDGITAWKEKEGICIGRQSDTEGSDEILELTAPGCFSFENNRIELCIKLQNTAKIPENTYTKWFDYDKIKNRLMLRRRRPEDIITIDDAGHHKKLNRFLIDRKIPQHIRDSLWILADGSSVVWLIGERIGAEYKVTEETQRILEITITGDYEHE